MGSDNSKSRSSIIAIAWNGVDEPCALVTFDEQPAFTILLFNYSGNGAVPAAHKNFQYDLLVNCRTEFKGHLLKELNRYLIDEKEYEYIGIIDDDIKMNISSVNELLRIARAHGLDACQPSLTHDSYHSFTFNLYQPGEELTYVPWVEIMCPFYRKTLFDACYPMGDENISSYGIDNYVIPFYQQLLDMKRTAVIHAVQVIHTKPVTDGDKRFSNGRTARQEGEVLRKKIWKLLHTTYTGSIPPTVAEDYFGDHKNFRQKMRDSMRVWLKRMKVIPMR